MIWLVCLYLYCPIQCWMGNKKLGHVNHQDFSFFYLSCIYNYVCLYDNYIGYSTEANKLLGCWLAAHKFILLLIYLFYTPDLHQNPRVFNNEVLLLYRRVADWPNSVWGVPFCKFMTLYHDSGTLRIPNLVCGSTVLHYD